MSEVLEEKGGPKGDTAEGQWLRMRDKERCIEKKSKFRRPFCKVAVRVGRNYSFFSEGFPLSALSNYMTGSCRSPDVQRVDRLRSMGH